MKLWVNDSKSGFFPYIFYISMLFCKNRGTVFKIMIKYFVINYIA